MILLIQISLPSCKCTDKIAPLGKRHIFKKSLNCFLLSGQNVEPGSSLSLRKSHMYCADKLFVTKDDDVIFFGLPETLYNILDTNYKCSEGFKLSSPST